MTTYERIDQWANRGFIGLMVAAASPIAGDVVSPWIGWPMFVGGAVTMVIAWVQMGREPRR